MSPAALLSPVVLPPTAQSQERHKYKGLGFSPDAMARMARALGTIGQASAAAALFDLARDNGAPVALKDIGMRAADLDRAADIAVSNAYWNPRPFGPAPKFVGMLGVVLYPVRQQERQPGQIIGRTLAGVFVNVMLAGHLTSSVLTRCDLQGVA